MITSPFPDHFRVLENVPLGPHTTWRIGGAARYLCFPSLAEIPQLLRICSENGIHPYILGKGSNVLISDNGLQGLVICPKRQQQIIQEGDQILAEAGASLPALSRFAANLGFGGYEFLIGIPGTVGGGVAMNAGLTSKVKRSVSDVFHSAEICLPTGERKWIDGSDMNFSYRSSRINADQFVLLRARFLLTDPVDQIIIRQRTAEHLADRKRKQPLAVPTAGSTFKKPDGGMPAGWYIEQSGMKGARVGRAQVSQKHANWIENMGGATAAEVQELIEIVRIRVRESFGISLTREVHYLPDDRSLTR